MGSGPGWIGGTGMGRLQRGLSAMGAGLTGGLVRGRMYRDQMDYRDRQYGLQERQMGLNEEAMKLHQKQGFLQGAKQALEITPDDQLERWMQYYNESAEQYGLPPLKGIRRSNKMQYELRTVGNDLYAIDLNDLSKTQKIASGQPKEQWGEPYSDEYGRIFQQEGRSGRVMQRSGASPEEYESYEDQAGNRISRSTRGRERRVLGAPKPVKPEMNETQALKEKASALKAKIDIDAVKDGDIITAELAKMNPLLAGLMGKQIDPQMKAELHKALDARIANADKYLQQGGTAGQAGAGSGKEVTAVNPKTGERLRLNPNTKQWEPVQ